MATDHIRYDILAQDALRGMVRTVLEDIAKSGLPGEHHFYITFDTGAEGVKVSQRMRAQYPQDMTIVLQHQFWDLIVTRRALRGRPVVWRHPGAAGGPVRGDHDLCRPFGAVRPAVPETSMPRPPLEARMRPFPTALRLAKTAAKGARPPAKQKKGRTVPSLAATPAAANPRRNLRHPSRPGGFRRWPR